MLTLLTQGRTWGPCHLALTFKCLTWASDPWDPKPMHIVLCWWHLHDEIPCLFRSLAIVDALMLMPICYLSFYHYWLQPGSPPKRFNQRSSQKAQNIAIWLSFLKNEISGSMDGFATFAMFWLPWYTAKFCVWRGTRTMDLSTIAQILFFLWKFQRGPGRLAPLLL